MRTWFTHPIFQLQRFIKSNRDDLELAGFIELPFLQISDLHTVPTRFYESLLYLAWVDQRVQPFYNYHNVSTRQL